jgi:hypothetical protein
MGRQPVGKRAMTAAERQRRRRERLAASKAKPASKPEPPRPAPAAPSADRKASTRERLLEHGLRNLKTERDLLRKEIAALQGLLKLPPDVDKRYRAFLRRARARDRAVLKYRVAEVERLVKEQDRLAKARSGAIPDRLWRDLMLCLHPDRSVSDAVLAGAFDEMRKREGVLRGR